MSLAALHLVLQLTILLFATQAQAGQRFGKPTKPPFPVNWDSEILLFRDKVIWRKLPYTTTTPRGHLSPGNVFPNHLNGPKQPPTTGLYPKLPKNSEDPIPPVNSDDGAPSAPDFDDPQPGGTVDVSPIHLENIIRSTKQPPDETNDPYAPLAPEEDILPLEDPFAVDIFPLERAWDTIKQTNFVLTNLRSPLPYPIPKQLNELLQRLKPLEESAPLMKLTATLDEAMSSDLLKLEQLLNQPEVQTRLPHILYKVERRMELYGAMIRAIKREIVQNGSKKLCARKITAQAEKLWQQFRNELSQAIEKWTNPSGTVADLQADVNRLHSSMERLRYEMLKLPGYSSIRNLCKPKASKPSQLGSKLITSPVQNSTGPSKVRYIYGSIVALPIVAYLPRLPQLIRNFLKHFNRSTQSTPTASDRFEVSPAAVITTEEHTFLTVGGAILILVVAISCCCWYYLFWRTKPSSASMMMIKSKQSSASPLSDTSG